MANPVRRQRVAEQIRQELGGILQSEVRDPRLGWVTVTRVEMSPDLAYAKIFVSVLGESADQDASIKVLNRAASFVRGRLGHRVRLRTVPELRFQLDHSLEHSQRILDLLNEERAQRPTPSEGASGEADQERGDAGAPGDDSAPPREPEGS